MNSSALILASFAADSLALGAHWIYDTAIIDREFGIIETLQQPLADSYHKNKKLGDFTHYGDQTLILLESIADHGGFNLDNFAADWQHRMSVYTGYQDKATMQTLTNLKEGKSPANCGSSSADLSGAARIAPLVYLYRNQQGLLLDSVRQQTRLTHNNAAVLAGVEALAKICWKVLHGTGPTKAIGEVINEGINDLDLDMRIRSGLDSAGKNSREAILSFGQACSITVALPGAIHLVATYENDLQKALIENVMAGGDSAARGLCVGMILGAHLGIEAVPKKWLSKIQAYPHILDLLGRMDGTESQNDKSGR